IIGAVTHAIVSRAASMLELPAPPPEVRTVDDVVESVITRLDGSSFTAPTSQGKDVVERLKRWTKPVTSTSRPQLVVQLEEPDRTGAWFLRVMGPGPNRKLVDVEVALSTAKSTRAV